MKQTVYIVDDEPMAIRYLEMLLKGTSLDVEVVGTAINGVRAIPEINRLQPDFVFVDISMPVMNGLQMSREVLKQNPLQKIFILTAYRDFEYARKRVGRFDSKKYEGSGKCKTEQTYSNGNESSKFLFVR